jgi:hypothetical protein
MDLIEFKKVELDIMRDDSRWKEFLQKVTFSCKKHKVKIVDMNGKYKRIQRSKQIFRGAIDYHLFHTNMFLLKHVIDRQVQ